jgi:site-specific recombinase XerD
MDSCEPSPWSLEVINRFKVYRDNLNFYVSSRTLRHTFAAHLAKKGMPLAGIQDLLGHVKEKNTKIYSRLFEHARKDMYDEWM